MPYPQHTSSRRGCLKAALFAAFIVPVHAAQAQGRGMEYEITLSGQVFGETTGDPIKGAMVLVKRDGHSQDLVVTRSDGRYSIQLERGSEYEVTYTANGQVAKRVLVSTKGAPAHLDVPFLTMDVDISLFPPLKNLSAALFDQPLGKAQYSSQVKNMVWDEKYGKEMRNRIRIFMTKYDAQFEKQEATAGH
jgi:hypothetical protein